MKNESISNRSDSSCNPLHSRVNICTPEEKVKKFIAIAMVLVTVFIALAIPCFAAGEGFYIKTVGAYSGLGSLNMGEWGSDYGIYGGFTILPSAYQYIYDLWSYEYKEDYTGIKFSIIYNLTANVPVNVLVPYQYQDVEVNRMLYYTYDSELSRVIIGTGVLNVKLDQINAGAGTYTLFYSGHSYSYDYQQNTQVIRLQVTASETGQYIVYYDINFKGAKTPSSISDIESAVDTVLNNQDALSILNYISTMLSYGWISVLVCITVVALLLGIIANWSQSL